MVSWHGCQDRKNTNRRASHELYCDNDNRDYLSDYRMDLLDREKEMKRKRMSKNKLTEYIHDLTGAPYKEVRAVCRVAYWEKDIAVAIALNSPLMTKKINDALTEAWRNVANASADIAEALRDKLNVSLSTLSESMRNLAEQINMSQNVP